MANYKKAFNLRSGVQVDEDNFIVNANGLVGIGTSIPREFLDVRGNVIVSGLVTASSVSSLNLTISGVATATSISVGNIIINSGIITATTGIITYYGDGSKLSNVPTSQWSTVSTPYGVNSIYNNSGAIGILTNYPFHYVQIGGNPITGSGVGFSSTGSIIASGIITSYGGFSGNASSATYATNSGVATYASSSGITTYSSNAGIATYATSSGISTYATSAGIATIATSIIQSSNILVNSINSGFSTSGISTVHTKLNVGTSGTIITTTSDGLVGIGTTNPTKKLHVVSVNPEVILVERNSGNNALIQYKNTTGSMYAGLTPSATGWGIDNNNSLLVSPYFIVNRTDGNVGLGTSTPSSKLTVIGNVNISGVTTIGENLVVSGNSLSNSLFGGTVIFNDKIGISTNNPSHSLQIGGNPSLNSSGVGISTNGSIVASGTVNCSGLTATGGSIIASNGFESNGGGLSVTGIITSYGGFSSNGGEPIVFSLSGNILTISIIGVGATSLTLYP